MAREEFRRRRVGHHLPRHPRGHGEAVEARRVGRLHVAPLDAGHEAHGGALLDPRRRREHRPALVPVKAHPHGRLGVEGARAAEGDCTEHATLLCAMLRADGIPARVGSGLIYADRFAGEEEIFGYHMWTQALLEIDGQERWVDLDPTLPSRAFDATHIAVATSSLAAGAIDAGAPVIERVDMLLK